MKKRILAMLLVLAMALSPPITVAAAQEDYAQIIADANEMSFDGELPTYCPKCGEGVTWTPLTQPEAAHIEMTSGHYYLAEDISLTNDAGEAYGYYITKGVEVCLHRNGKSIVSYGNHIKGEKCYSSVRVNGGSLNLMGEGLVSGSAYNWGALDVSGTVNVYGGSIYNNTGNRRAVIGKGGETNLYDVTVEKGWIYVTGGVVNVESGTYEGVWTDADSATANINGGTITSINNSAATVTMAGTLNITGGNIGTLHIRDTLGTTTISGAPVIGAVKTIADGDKMLTIGTLTEGAKINLGDRTGVFTTPFASKEAAKAAIPYFTVTTGDSILVSEDNCLTTGRDAYRVGYSKVDINPYADGTGESQTLMEIGMPGYGNNDSRLSLPDKYDDNGDGVVDENDGIFATCTAITDKEGNTALVFTLDLLWGYDADYGDYVLETLLQDEEFADCGLSADRIFFNGSHNHFAVDVNEAFAEILKKQLLQAAREALADRAWADMYEGSLNVTEYFNTGSNKDQKVGDLLNEMRAENGAEAITEKTYAAAVENNDVLFTLSRHFKITAQKALLDGNGNPIADPASGHTWKVDPSAEPVTYYAGNGFNGDWAGVGFLKEVYEYNEETGIVYDGTNGTEKRVKEVRVVTGWEEATPADDTLRVVQFRFGSDSGKDPIAMINWRGHLPSCADLSETSYYQVSGGMVNALRNAMAFKGYRASFLQGETGGINMENKCVESNWMRIDASQKTNIFGTELAQLALTVAENSEKINKDGGQIQGLRQVYQTDYVHSTPFEYMAAMRYKIAYAANNKSPIGKRVYTGLSYYVDASGNPLIDTTGQTYTTNAGGETIAVGDPVQMGANEAITISSWDEADRRDRSYKHKDSIGEYYNEVTLNALTIGSDFSLVSVCAEIFDHYIGEKGENLWDTMKAEHKNLYILGVTNGPGGGYMPAKNNYGLAASDNEPTYVVGTYESNGTRYAQGTGEAVVGQLDAMLDFLEEAHPQIQTTEGNCQHCDKTVTWTDLTQVVAEGRLPFERTFTTGHYKLSGETDLTGISVPEGAEVCIDLCGQTLNVYRNIVIDNGGKLNMIDSQSAGTVMGYEALKSGGIFTVSEGAELNIYGGTYRYDEASRRPASGGIVCVNGEFTLYDGTLEGTGVSLAGGAVLVNSTGHAFFRGGKVTNGYITSGAANGNGVTIYGQVTLSGDPNIDSLFYIGYSGSKEDPQNIETQKLNLDGVFTGNVAVSGVEVNDPCIGVASADADVSLGTLSQNNSHHFHIEDGLVYLRPATDYVAKTPTGEFIYGDYTADANTVDESKLLNTVLQTLPDGSRVVMLANIASSATVAVNQNLQWELKGRTVNCNFTVAENKSIFFTDCVGTGKVNLAKVTGTVGNASASEDGKTVYVPITGNDGYATLHQARVNIDELVLRANNQDESGKASPGIYFKHRFDGDDAVKDQVESYGIAFSLTGAPTAADLQAEGTLLYEDGIVYRNGNVIYTKHDGASFGETDAESTSTLITGVMKEENGVSTNDKNAKMPIYGVAYIKLTDGTVALGQVRQRSLQEQMEGVDAQWDNLTHAQRKGVLKMYKQPTIKSVVDGWDVPNLKDPTKIQADSEKQILRVLSIGNSHTDNATEYLYDVFKAENPNQEVMIAQLYYSGCSVSQHVDFMAKDAAVYRYRTQDNRNPSGYSTMKQALQAEIWDVIILHEMNNSAGAESTYTGANKLDLQKHINNIRKYSLNPDPELIWNFSWANPTDATLMATTSAGWATRYENNWGTDYDTMLDSMIDNTQKYVLKNSAFGNRVIPTGLAFQNARNAYIAAGHTQSDADNLLYCDYTHAGPGFGRLLVSYVWYATLTGQTEFTELKYARDLTEDQQELLIDALNYALANKASLLPQ